MNILDKYYRVYASVNLDAIYDNMKNIKENTKDGTGMIAVIKTDGYGHGAVPIAKTVDELVWGYAVATSDEGVNLRTNGVTKPVIILGYTHESQYEKIVENDLRPAIFTFEDAKKLSDVACSESKKAKIHIKIDTGMSRIGFHPDKDSVKVISDISRLPGIEIEGIFTHFYASDETDKTSAYEQYKIFNYIISELEKQGVNIPIKHCSNSAAIIDMPDVNMDCVRVGIALYGMYPSDEVDKTKVKLTPAMELKSHIICLKEVEKGVGISYGATYVTSEKTKVATVSVGYGDGYRRSLSNKGYVLIRGQKAPILGRVCMDQFMVDVTHIKDVQRGDVVTLLGKDGDMEITAEELAGMAGETFNYEIVCDIGKRIPRVFYRHGEIVAMKDYFYDKY
ncbi:alanine racemase [Lachnospiraceae bacterium HCP1S3_C3]|nr:alanine racemase [Lachnospiraceae bacterium]MDD6857547.1 alanine racemase [Lachnospiraceae bacterium]